MWLFSYCGETFLQKCAIKASMQNTPTQVMKIQTGLVAVEKYDPYLG